MVSFRFSRHLFSCINFLHFFPSVNVVYGKIDIVLYCILYFNIMMVPVVLGLAYICFSRQGSVIASFNVSYMAIDSLQIVALQDQIVEETLAGSPATLVSISSTKGTQEKCIFCSNCLPNGSV